jgi:hypothetical protein
VQDGIELFRLYQRKSASGRTYFIGRLGGARIAVLKDNDAPVDETTLGVWKVMVQHRDPDRTGTNRNDQHTPSTAKQPTVRQPARAKARPAPGKLPSTAQAKAIEDIHRRYPGELNDDIPEL